MRVLYVLDSMKESIGEYKESIVADCTDKRFFLWS